MVYSEESDVVFVNETWLNEGVNNVEILHSGYNILRNDRGSRGGGVLLAIKSESFQSVKKIDCKYDLEFVSAEVVTSSNTTLLLCSCYRPPNVDQTWLNYFENYLADICNNYQNIVLAGDFNMPHVCWDNQKNMVMGSQEIAFTEILKDFFLTQINTTPTRNDNVLDLIITSVPDLVNMQEVFSPTEAELFTDHSIINFDIFLSPKVLPKIHRTIYDSRRRNFDALRNSIEANVLSDLISTDGDIDGDWSRWKGAFLDAVSEHVPTKTFRRRHHVPWINGDILYQIKKKNSIRKRLKTSPTEHLRNRYKSMRTLVKQMMKESRSSYINSLCNDSSINPKRFWSLFKIKSKKQCVPDKISVNSDGCVRSSADNPEDVAKLFNSYFVSIFNTDVDSKEINEVESSDTTAVLTDIHLTEDLVYSILRNLDNSKAHGPDQLPARLLTETSRQITPSLTALFNKSLRTGQLPKDWKLANVVPVFKQGNTEHVENYRPISLLSLISKTLERCIFNTIKDQVFDQINSSQHGFVAGKSCVTQLLEVLDHIGSQMDHGKQIDVIYLDMSKAFDKVSHHRLIHRLRDFGFGGSILKWFGSYLRDRHQQTTVLGATSSPLPVTSGVPQGSILGPLLFILYANNLSNSVTNSELSSFADDTKLFKEISTLSDAIKLQNDLSNFEIATTNADLQLNVQKCSTLNITRKRNKILYDYHLHDSVLQRSDCEKDLGVWINSKLTWSNHVSTVGNKANQLLGYIRRSTRNLTSTSIRRTLYLALVRSQLGYASQVWSPQLIDNISRIERIQRRATKYILNLPFNCDIDYQHRLIMTNLLPITYWHEYLDIIFFYKANHGFYSLNPDLLPIPQNRRPTRSFNPDCLKYTVKRCKTSTYQKAFFIRSTRTWNTLPDYVTSNTNSTFNSFKKKLFNHYVTALHNTYNPEDPRTWKSVCLKCNTARDISTTPTCCF